MFEEQHAQPKWRGIRSRILVIPAALLLLTAVGMAMLVSSTLRRQHAESMHQTAGVMAHHLARQMQRLVHQGIRPEDAAGFDARCREVLAGDGSFSYARVLDRDGRILFRNDSTNPTPGETMPAELLADSGLIAFRDARGEAHYAAAGPIVDTAGQTVAWAIVAFPRESIDARTREILWWSLAIGGSVLAATTGLMALMVSANVTWPMSRLIRRIHEIRTTGNLDGRLKVESHDELADLVRAINGLLHDIRDRELSRAHRELETEMARRREAEEKRQQAQAHLVEASRKAGMADVATGVLHNVGNVLNSINVTTQLLITELRKSQVSSLVLAGRMIEQHLHDLPEFLGNDERGKQLAPFLVMLARRLDEEHRATVRELDGLMNNINHIKEIVATQQSLAKMAGVIEEVSVAEMVDNALKINQAGLVRHGVTLQRQIDESLRVQTDSHKVLQILINLVSNAKYAMSSTERVDRILTVRTEVDTQDGEKHVSIIVTDNGEGIAPENLSRIFGYGFTTKRHGHGFGLHSSALAAREIGGALSVESEGRGKGATFRLRLPMRRSEQAPPTAEAA